MDEQLWLPHLEKIRTELWNGAEYGNVSLMVGAGFSRNSERNSINVPNYPLWNNLANEMINELNYGENSNNAIDQLKIASEYEAMFGREVLKNFLKKQLPDKESFPGTLYGMLLKLPWADVFTTNYDTLLERTLPDVHERKYEVVNKIEDIPKSRSPRIIKLNGSLPDLSPFILTEEDFRQYPQRFAPFVNMVQQSLMENTFCLIGFSGEDPNFLQWTGWIRDNLGREAPNIYLIGVLGLSPSRRKLFETRGVIPIDLGTEFTKKYGGMDELNAKALEWLLLFLKKGAPFNPLRWPTLKQYIPFLEGKREELPPIPDSQYSKDCGQMLLHRPILQDKKNNEELNKSHLEKVLKRWKIERENYPGWIVAPSSSRDSLWLYTERHIDFIFEHLDKLPYPDNIALVFELTWRLEKSLVPIISDWISPIEKILESYNSFTDSGVLNDKYGIADYWLEPAFAVLKYARENYDDEKFSKWNTRLESICIYKKGVKTRLHYEQCMFHLYKLDFEEVKKCLNNWPESMGDLHLEAKRLGVLVEVGEIKTAETSGKNLLNEIRRQQVAGNVDYYLLSLEGWVMYLLNAIAFSLSLRSWNEEVKDVREANRARWERLNIFKCNPWIEINEIKLKLDSPTSSYTPATTMTNNFDPGRYSTAFNFGAEGSNFEATLPAFNFFRMLEEAGLPLKCAGVDLYSQSAVNAAKWIEEYSPISSLIRFARTAEVNAKAATEEGADIKGADIFFDRISTSVLSENTLNQLYPLLEKAWEQSINGLCIDFYQDNPILISNSYKEFVILSEIISRLCFRLSEKDQERIFAIAINLYKSPVVRGFPIIHSNVSLIFKRLFLALSDQIILQQMATLLSLPVLGEDFEVLDRNQWPKPFCNISLTKGFILPKNFDRGKWNKSIERVLSILERGDDKTIRFALFRLCAIHYINGLNEQEKERFATLLWEKFVQKGAFEKSGLPPFCFLHLPAINIEKTKIEVKKFLLKDKKFKIAQFSPTDVENFLNNHLRVLPPLWLVEEESKNYISWTKNDLLKIFKQILQLWTENKQSLTDKFKASYIRPILQMIPEILALVILPHLKISDDKEIISDIEVLINELGEFGVPSISSKPGLLFFKVDLLESIKDEISDGIESVDSQDVNDSIRGIFNWIVYNRFDSSFPPLPRDFIDKLILIVSLRRQPGLQVAIEQLCRIIENLPDFFKDDHIKRILRALNNLVEGTNPNTLKEKIQPNTYFPIQINELPQYREKISQLSFSLYRYYRKRETKVPDILIKHKEILLKDPLPEVRKIWDEKI